MALDEQGCSECQYEIDQDEVSGGAQPCTSTPPQSRAQFVILVDDDRASVDAAAATLLDIVIPEAELGILDGYVDDDDGVPTPVTEERRRLEEQHGKDNLTALPFRLGEEQEARVFRLMAPWSIHAELVDANGTDLATFHDGGTSLSALLTWQGADRLRARLLDAGCGAVEVVEADEWARRRRAARRPWIRRFLRNTHSRG